MVANLVTVGFWKRSLPRDPVAQPGIADGNGGIEVIPPKDEGEERHTKHEFWVVFGGLEML